MYVVTVQFEVLPQFAAQFEAALRTNAADSRRLEPGCLQFDVCLAPSDRTCIFLYEVYVDEAAFAVHIRTEHFRRFDAGTRDWVRDKKVDVYRRMSLGAA